MKPIEERTEQIARVHARIPSSARTAAAQARPEPSSSARTSKAEHPKHEVRRRKAKDEDEVLERARGGRKGAKFAALFDGGDWEGQGYTSQSEADLALCSLLGANCGGDPARVEALFRQSALMRSKWDDPHYSDGRTYGEETVRKATELYQAVDLGADEPHRIRIPDVHFLLSLTQAGGRLMERHPHDLMWSHVGARYRWVGSHWMEDRQAVAEQWADDVALSYRLEADQLGAIARALDEGGLDLELMAALEEQFPREPSTGGKPRWEERVAGELWTRAKDLVAFFKRLERPAGFTELLGRVAAYHTHAAEELDAKPLLLACPNGTLDLSTGELRPGDRGDLITKLTAIDYVEGARSEAWEPALVAWTDGDESLARYLQVGYGYSLLGNPILGRFCFMLHGPGQSGRSALLETLAAALGDYASSFSWRAFEHKKGASHDEDLAALRGLRFVFSNEAGDVLLDTEKLKAVTSGEEQHVSRKHEKAFRMRPSFVVWAATNRLPELPSDDLALWTRIRVIPFKRVFPLSPFRDKLARAPEVLRSVLAWGVAGARYYLDHGLPECAAVDAATATAQRELNPLSAWMEERTEAAAEAWTPVGQLFVDYQRWCDRCRVALPRRVGDRHFGGLLKARGFEPARRNGVRGNLGIRISRGGASAV